METLLAVCLYTGSIAVVYLVLEALIRFDAWLDRQ